MWWLLFWANYECNDYLVGWLSCFFLSYLIVLHPLIFAYVVHKVILSVYLTIRKNIILWNDKCNAACWPEVLVGLYIAVEFSFLNCGPQIFIPLYFFLLNFYYSCMFQLMRAFKQSGWWGCAYPVSLWFKVGTWRDTNVRLRNIWTTLSGLNIWL